MLEIEHQKIIIIISTVFWRRITFFLENLPRPTRGDSFSADVPVWVDDLTIPVWVADLVFIWDDKEDNSSWSFSVLSFLFPGLGDFDDVSMVTLLVVEGGNDEETSTLSWTVAAKGLLGDRTSVGVTGVHGGVEGLQTLLDKKGLSELMTSSTWAAVKFPSTGSTLVMLTAVLLLSSVEFDCMGFVEPGGYWKTAPSTLSTWLSTESTWWSLDKDGRWTSWWFSQEGGTIIDDLFGSGCWGTERVSWSGAGLDRGSVENRGTVCQNCWNMEIKS